MEHTPRGMGRVLLVGMVDCVGHRLLEGGPAEESPKLLVVEGFAGLQNLTDDALEVLSRCSPSVC